MTRSLTIVALLFATHGCARQPLLSDPESAQFKPASAEPESVFQDCDDKLESLRTGLARDRTAPRTVIAAGDRG